MFLTRWSPMSYIMTTSQERHLIHQHIVHLHASKSRSWRRWPSRVAQVKRKKRRHAKTPQMMKKSQWTPIFTCKSKRWTNACKKSTQWGYMVFLKDGPHHQQMKVERRFKKKKKKGEEAQTWIICHFWWMGKRWWRIKRKIKWWIKQKIHHSHGIII